jgi:hypothetical protein
MILRATGERMNTGMHACPQSNNYTAGCVWVGGGGTYTSSWRRGQSCMILRARGGRDEHMNA